MDDRGGNLGANVEIKCLSCGRAPQHPRGARPARRRQAATVPRPASAPRRLRAGRCKAAAQAARRRRVQPVVRADPVRAGRAADRGERAAGQGRAALGRRWSGCPAVDMLPYLRTVVPAFRELEKWTDDEIWAAIETHRAGADRTTARSTPTRTCVRPSGRSSPPPQLPPATDDFTLRRDPDGVPGVAEGLLRRRDPGRAAAGGARARRLHPPRRPRPGRSRTSSPVHRWLGPSRPGCRRARCAARGSSCACPRTCCPTGRRGCETATAMQAHRDAYARFRRNRYSGRITGAFDPMRLWPGERYIALHTLSHLLIRTIALECGYSSASLSERIYAGDDDDPRGGILIYTAVPGRRRHAGRTGLAGRGGAADPAHPPGARRRDALLVRSAVRRAAPAVSRWTFCTARRATCACSSPRRPASAATGSSTADSSYPSTTRTWRSYPSCHDGD